MEKKKQAFLGVLAIISLAYCFCFFAPILGASVGESYVYMNIIGYAQNAELLYVIGTILGPVVALFGSVLLWLGFLLKDNAQGDLKDKRYLLGTLLFILGAVVAGVSGMVSKCYIHMMISVFLAVIYGALIVFHNKYLTSY